jgi:hypothetical protein
MESPADSTVSNGPNGADDGRSERGRFGPANRFGRGNPQARRQYELRQMLLDAVDRDKLVEAFGRLQDQAATGDLASLNLYLSYAIGKPTQAVELSGPEGAPLGGDLVGLVMSALAGFPEARFAVAAELRAIRDARPGSEEG